MDNTDRHISTLWEQAKVEAPQKSFEETQAAFTASASGAGGTTSGFDSIINLNSIIMSSIVIVAASLVWSFWSSPEIETMATMPERPIKEVITPGYPNQRTVILTEPIAKLQRVEKEEKEKAIAKATTDDKMMAMETSSPSELSKQVDFLERPDYYISKGSWDHGGSKETKGAVDPGEKEQLFIITNDTSIEELERIKGLAAKAGVTMDYKTRGNIRWINIRLTMDTGDGQSSTSITLDGTFEMYIGWVEDEQGTALRFSSGEGEDDNQFMVGSDSPLFDDTDMPELEPMPDAPKSPRLFDREIERVESRSDGKVADPGVPPTPGMPAIPALDNEGVPRLEKGQARVVVHIDRSTTAEEIEGYTGEAERAGLELDVVSFKSKVLKVNLKGPESMMTITSDVDSKEDPLEVTLGWVVDADGNYVRFLEREELELED